MQSHCNCTLCSRPLLLLSHRLLLFCPISPLFLKKLLSSRPRSFSSKTLQTWGAICQFFGVLYLKKSYPAHKMCFCVGAEHTHKGSTQNLCRRRSSIYLSQVRVAAPLSFHRHKQIYYQLSNWDANSLGCWTHDKGKKGLILMAAHQNLEGYHQRECGCHHQQTRPQQLRTSAISIHKPQFSSLLYQGRNSCHDAVVFCDCAEACKISTFQCPSYNLGI